MAYDISKLLTIEHLQFYADLATEELKKEEKSNLIYHFMKYYGNTEMDDISNYYEPCRLIWSVFAEICNNELEERKKQCA